MNPQPRTARPTLSLHGLLAMLACLLAATAHARHAHHAPESGGVPGQFDYYLLSLSWSPAYCLVHPEDRGRQCRTRGLGFVLHGLWPQFDGGGYPQNCAADATLDEAAFQVGRTIYPSPKLVSHEWGRHGSCSGLAPLLYFRTADRARALVRIPPAFDAPRLDTAMTAQQIAASFIAANPGIPADGIAVGCSRGRLAEVRVCLTRDLKPRSCGRGVRNSCPRVPVVVPASR
ncbi:MAG TPA: ribonuclease T2 [Steroidobacteraceae bacterium]|nr:ribonuclease T2 [Steroidobacteraceae bacterium]